MYLVLTAGMSMPSKKTSRNICCLLCNSVMDTSKNQSQCMSGPPQRGMFFTKLAQKGKRFYVILRMSLKNELKRKIKSLNDLFV